MSDAKMAALHAALAELQVKIEAFSKAAAELFPGAEGEEHQRVCTQFMFDLGQAMGLMVRGNRDGVKAGDIVRSTIQNHFSEDLLFQVTDVRGWGVKCEAATAEGLIPMRLNWNQFEASP